MPSSFDLDIKDMTAKISRAAARTPRVIESALFVETEIEATEVKERTPVATGFLRSTIMASEPTWEGRTVFTEISAGTNYAIYVHERLDLHHPVGQAKFIESVLMESAPFFVQRVANRINLSEVLGG